MKKRRKNLHFSASLNRLNLGFNSLKGFSNFLLYNTTLIFSEIFFQLNISLSYIKFSSFLSLFINLMLSIIPRFQHIQSYINLILFFISLKCSCSSTKSFLIFFTFCVIYLILLLPSSLSLIVFHL
jgi:hypothetical protein